MKQFIIIFLIPSVASVNISENPDLKNANRGIQKASKNVPQKVLKRSQIKITKNGNTFVAYDSPRGSGLMDEGHLTIELGIPGHPHSLVIEIENVKTEIFPVSNSTESDKAVLIFLSDQLPLVRSPKSGNLKNTELTKLRCSGSFIGEANFDGHLLVR